ncbi:MAG: hypothetical protein ABL958_07095, partial [Bdellovibrionia bacterium]
TAIPQLYRHLNRWREILSEEDRSFAIETAKETNKRTSRTLSMGKSGKDFAQGENFIYETANNNLEAAHRQMLIWSKQSLNSPEQLVAQISKFNELLTTDVGAIERGVVGTPGKLRDYRISIDERLGRSVEEIQQEFYHAAIRIFNDINNPAMDPVKTASWAFMKISEFIKPHFDGNGRTGHLLVDYILLRRGYPPPTYVGDVQWDPVRRKLTGYHALANTSLELFTHFLNQSVKETVRLALKRETPNEVAIPPTWEFANGLGSGTRAHAWLVRGTDGVLAVLKMAANFAAFAETLKEVETMRLVAAHGLSSLKPPKVFDYGTNGTYLLKEYRSGLLGSEFQKLSTRQRSSLRKIFAETKKLRDETGVQLDIIPDNLVWNEAGRKFELIDYGPRMTILDLETFDTYLAQNWK